MAVIGGGESWRLEGWLEGVGCYDNFDSYPKSSEFDLKASTFFGLKRVDTKPSPHPHPHPQPPPPIIRARPPK